jgi:S-DNA-T family DNA segregation ATPase FtsK/SpoIIIE
MKNRTQSSRYKKGSLGRYLATLSHLSTVISAALTCFVGISLFSYHPHDQSWFYYSTHPLPVFNYAGPLGAQVAAFCFYFWGKAAYVLLGIGVYTTYLLWKKRAVEEELDRVLGLTSLLFSWSAFLSVHHVGQKPYMLAGGFLGKKGFVWLVSLFDATGALVFLYVLLACQLLLISRLSGIQLLVGLQNTLMYLFKTRRSWVEPIIKLIHFLWYAVAQLLQGAGRLLLFGAQSFWNFVYASQKESELQKKYEERPFEESFWEEHAQLKAASDFAKASTDSGPQRESSKEKAQPERQLARGRQQPQVEDVSSPKKNVFQLPSLSLFVQSPKEERLTKNDESKHSAALLEEKLSHFGVTGTIVGTKKGPVVTLFEYQPSIDTKLSKIVSLEQDLALALEAMSVRIVAPIPGTSRVGFEVSNKERKSVRMGDLVTCAAYQHNKGSLPLILGQDTTGTQVIVDLADMPHLLIAGSTGSGKSIALNTMLISLLCRLTPDELRLIIIDPKRLEFAAYHDIPHLLFPILTDPHRAAPVIRWLVKVMEDRYQLMAEQGVRSITEYKKSCVQEGKKDELPFIVLMIDELADLMMVAGKESEEGIARLAQMARAAGIHLIVATQRPSVDVVTGVIKVNFPSRISFRLTSKIDSRTILDVSGAESLLGKGDMLFMDASSARMRRVHGAYVSDAEIKKVTDALRAQQKVQYIDLQAAVDLYQAYHQEAEEPLLKDIIQFLATIDEVSISLLQRRFKIGYNRSARVIELLEMQGKVMPADGSKMRKVLH